MRPLDPLRTPSREAVGEEALLCAHHGDGKEKAVLATRPVALGIVVLFPTRLLSVTFLGPRSLSLHSAPRGSCFQWEPGWSVLTPHHPAWNPPSAFTSRGPRLPVQGAHLAHASSPVECYLFTAVISQTTVLKFTETGNKQRK